MMTVLNFSAGGDCSSVCETQVVADIWRLIDLTIELRCIGSVVGEPGVGKTTAAQAYASRHFRACYCAMDPVRDSMSGMLGLVRAAVTPWGAPASLNIALHRAISDAIKRSCLKVLLVDEAQHLNARNLDQLRCIHDQTGMPLVLLGNASLGSRFNATRAAAFGQLTSRIGPKLHIEASTEVDLRAFASHAGVHEPRAIAFLEKWATDTSGLRQVAILLRLGREVSGDGDIKLAHLKQAANILGGAR